MADISVDIRTPELHGIEKRLDPTARGELHREIAAEISETVREHLRGYALDHHKTAAALGARPTGNLEDARVDASSDGEGATVTVAALGIRRAIGEVTITPKDRRALTIPVAAIAYGRTVAYLERSGIDIFRPKGKNYLARTVETGGKREIEPLYILVRRATLPHEPDLLPSRQTLCENAAEAARWYLMEGAA